MNHGLAIPAFNLVVIRVKDIQLSLKFYECLGLNFVPGKHGTGPDHFAAELNGVVFEIYQETPDNPATKIRLGFQVYSIQNIIQLVQKMGGTIVSPIKETSAGLKVVLLDPNENRLELFERRNCQEMN